MSRNVLFAVGFHAVAVGIGWWWHPGAGLTVWGLGICLPLALGRVLGADRLMPPPDPAGSESGGPGMED